jgi:hypothetical protein
LPSFLTQHNIEKHYQANEVALFYASMAPSLVRNLGRAISQGQLPLLQPGSILLVRFEARITFIHAVEQCFEGASVSLMGSELEPTSCHALEGTEVDTVLDAILDVSDHPSLFNPHFVHSLKVFTWFLYKTRLRADIASHT